MSDFKIITNPSGKYKTETVERDRNQERPMDKQEINFNGPSTSVNGKSIDWWLSEEEKEQLTQAWSNDAENCKWRNSGEPLMRKNPTESVNYTSTMLMPTPKQASIEGTKHFQKLEDYYQYIDMKCKELVEYYNQFLDEQKVSSDYYLEPTELW